MSTAAQARRAPTLETPNETLSRSWSPPAVVFRDKVLANIATGERVRGLPHAEGEKLRAELAKLVVHIIALDQKCLRAANGFWKEESAV